MMEERNYQKMKMKSAIAMLLALVMAFSLFGCASGSSNNGSSAAPESSGTEPAPEKDADTPLVVGYANFNAKFSPFFAETAYDQDVAGMTQIALLTTDRVGSVIYKGIEGETINYNGTDYTYYGPADLVVTENDDGTVFYDFTLRDDLVFSDGEKVTVDDVIFSMYVVCDPTYDGSTTLFSQPIQGMEEYRSGMDTLGNLIYGAGRDNTDFTFFTEDDAKAYWDTYDSAALALAEEIYAYCKEAGYADEGDYQAAASAWGFSAAENSAESFAAALQEAYGSDIAGMINTENAGSTVDDLFPNLGYYTGTGVATGESAPNISGIQKIDDTHLRVVATKVDATMIYQLAMTIAPMHYYGDASLYDYDNNMFGFTKGDLSTVRAKISEPMGAGPYKYLKYENGVVNFEANDLYYKGAPKIKYVNFREGSDQDRRNGVVQGSFDITDPSFNADTVKAIKEANGNDDITGPVITTSTVDNLGYGYIGINSINVNVGGEPGSEASRNLRRALATVFSVYRDVAIDSYYGERAAVINYPISNTSWAAPQPADDGYELAFSTDVNGNPIYTSDMNADAKYEAALNAALGFFEAAGYTVEDGKLTAAPEGASLEYECLIPGDGTGDHPSFMVMTLSKEALAKIGFNLIVTDLADSSVLWDTTNAGQQEIWCAAWGATIDPDMYQIYYSDVANGPSAPAPKVNPLGGPKQGGSSYMYGIADPELDEMILDARASTNQTYRKSVYKAALDKVISWACEIPVYQRQNAIIFSTERVNIDTVTPDITTFYGWMSEIENLELN